MEQFSIVEGCRRVYTAVGRIIIGGLEAIGDANDVWDDKDMPLPGLTIYPAGEENITRGQE